MCAFVRKTFACVSCVFLVLVCLSCLFSCFLLLSLILFVVFNTGLLLPQSPRKILTVGHVYSDLSGVACVCGILCSHLCVGVVAPRACVYVCVCVCTCVTWAGAGRGGQLSGKEGGGGVGQCGSLCSPIMGGLVCEMFKC